MQFEQRDILRRRCAADLVLTAVSRFAGDWTLARSVARATFVTTRRTLAMAGLSGIVIQ